MRLGIMPLSSAAPAYRDGIAGGPGLFAFLHLHPAPLGVVVALAAWMRSQTILAALQGESIQDPESGLPRKNLLGTSVNKGRLLDCWGTFSMVPG